MKLVWQNIGLSNRIWITFARILEQIWQNTGWLRLVGSLKS